MSVIISSIASPSCSHPSFPDHHANMKITHKCVNGVDLELELFSFEAKELTEKDFDAARAIDLVYAGNPINMKDYTYDLKQESIALFPADPRGSSKLLRVNSEGLVSYFDHFGKNISSLLEGCHVVFNNSRVLDARLAVDLGDGNEEVELMVSNLSIIFRLEWCVVSSILSHIDFVNTHSY